MTGRSSRLRTVRSRLCGRVLSVANRAGRPSARGASAGRPSVNAHDLDSELAAAFGGYTACLELTHRTVLRASRRCLRWRGVVFRRCATWRAVAGGSPTGRRRAGASAGSSPRPATPRCTCAVPNTSPGPRVPRFSRSSRCSSALRRSHGEFRPPAGSGRQPRIRCAGQGSRRAVGVWPGRGIRDGGRGPAPGGGAVPGSLLPRPGLPQGRSTLARRGAPAGARSRRRVVAAWTRAGRDPSDPDLLGRWLATGVSREDVEVLAQSGSTWRHVAEVAYHLDRPVRVVAGVLAQWYRVGCRLTGADLLPLDELGIAETYRPSGSAIDEIEATVSVMAEPPSRTELGGMLALAGTRAAVVEAVFDGRFTRLAWQRARAVHRRRPSQESGRYRAQPGRLRGRPAGDVDLHQRQDPGAPVGQPRRREDGGRRVSGEVGLARRDPHREPLRTQRLRRPSDRRSRRAVTSTIGVGDPAEPGRGSVDRVLRRLQHGEPGAQRRRCG